nr:myb domain protein 62 [Tanacetum cinerariifolium]
MAELVLDFKIWLCKVCYVLLYADAVGYLVQYRYGSGSGLCMCNKVFIIDKGFSSLWCSVSMSLMNEYAMSGPGKEALKKVGFQSLSSSHEVLKPYNSSKSQDVPQPHNSSSRHEISKPSKLSKSQHVSHPHKSVRENDIQESQPKVLRKRQAYMQLEDEEIQEELERTTFKNLSLRYYERDKIICNQKIKRFKKRCRLSTSVTQKETRALNEAKKRRLDKGKLVFEIDECSGHIIRQDNQKRFIFKGGCLVREYGMFDGTTWKKHPDSLKTDIISKCVENSTFDRKCKRSVDAIDSQLGNQHKNRQYRLHVIYNKFPTYEEALVDPPSGIELSDWVKLCDKFASEKFQMISEQNKKNHSFNLIPPIVGKKSVARRIDMNKLRSEEAAGSGTPTEICFKLLKRVPGHLKGRSAPKKEILAVENLRAIVES